MTTTKKPLLPPPAFDEVGAFELGRVGAGQGLIAVAAHMVAPADAILAAALAFFDPEAEDEVTEGHLRMWCHCGPCICGKASHREWCHCGPSFEATMPNEQAQTMTTLWLELHPRGMPAAWGGLHDPYYEYGYPPALVPGRKP